MQKPGRFLADKVSFVAEEAAAYLRRRKLSRRPFVRIHLAGGRILAPDPASPQGERLLDAAEALLSAAAAARE